MLRRSLILILFISTGCFFPQKSFALAKDSSQFIKLYEDTLKQLQFGRLDFHKTDRQKEAANIRFLALVQKALSLPGSFDYPFDSLTTIARLESPDKQFRIINWNMPLHDGTQEYFGFIQSINPKTKKYVLYPLLDKSEDVKDPMSKTFTTDQWLGMLYYKIILEKIDKKPIYTVLAWKGYSKEMTKKVIDVISLNKDGVPSFGKAVFSKLPSNYKGTPKRLIFQYSSNVSMTLDYNTKTGIIQFDHLGPTEPGLEGQYQYYGPSFQIDGLQFVKGSWEYIVNVDARNGDQGKDKSFQKPTDDNYKVGKKPVYTPH